MANASTKIILQSHHASKLELYYYKAKVYMKGVFSILCKAPEGLFTRPFSANFQHWREKQTILIYIYIPLNFSHISNRYSYSRTVKCDFIEFETKYLVNFHWTESWFHNFGFFKPWICSVSTHNRINNSNRIWPPKQNILLAKHRVTELDIDYLEKKWISPPHFCPKLTTVVA